MWPRLRTQGFEARYGSLCTEPGELDELRDAIDIESHNRGKSIGRIRHHLASCVEKLLLHVVAVERFRKLLMEPVDDRRGRSGRSKNTLRRHRFETRQSTRGNGRYAGRERRRLRAAYGD